MKQWSVLTRGLPETVTVDGTAVPICTDYRLGILMQELASDPMLDEGTRMELVLEMYCGGVPEGVDAGKLFLAVLDFYAIDPDRERRTDGGRGEAVLDFDADGDMILAGFRQTYGIDLTEVRLHWWHFMALLLALPEDTVFMQTVRLRCMDVRQIQDDTLRRRMRQAKAAVRIRDKRKRDTAKGGE